MQILKEAPKRIRHGLKVREMSQRELSRLVGWQSHGLLARMLSGEVRSIDSVKAVRLAAILQIPMDDLFLPRLSSITEQNVKQTRKAAA